MKLDRPQPSDKKKKEKPLKAFKLFFESSIGKPNFSRYRVVEPKLSSRVLP
jgi:hypothetical protein